MLVGLACGWRVRHTNYITNRPWVPVTRWYKKLYSRARLLLFAPGRDADDQQRLASRENSRAMVRSLGRELLELF
jgi:hypothetical protein